MLKNKGTGVYLLIALIALITQIQHKQRQTSPSFSGAEDSHSAGRGH